MAAAAALTPDTILHDLAELWVTLGQQGQIESGTGVLRACSMTLVVVTDDEDSQELGETLAALMPEHPARVITLRLDTKRQPDLAGRVFAQCWMPFGQRRQICCEQIEITSSAAALEDAIALVDAVAAPDLPVIVWCRSLRLIERPEFRQFSALATRVVVDSRRSPDPRATIRLLAEIASRRFRIGDLSWTGLTRWREMLAQSFERRQPPANVTVRVGFGGQTAPVQALYMAAWVAESLKAAGCSVTVTLEPAASAADGELAGVELTGEGLHIALTHTENRLRIEMNGLSRCANLPPASHYLLMREELGIERPDPVFERTLAAAKGL